MKISKTCSLANLKALENAILDKRRVQLKTYSQKPIKDRFRLFTASLRVFVWELICWW